MTTENVPVTVIAIYQTVNRCPLPTLTVDITLTRLAVDYKQLYNQEGEIFQSNPSFLCEVMASSKARVTYISIFDGAGSSGDRK